MKNHPLRVCGNAFRALLFVISSLAVCSVVKAQSAQDAAYPQSAVLIPLANKADFQSYLDTYRVVRLEAGDYASGGPASITLTSNQEIYGHPGGTTIPPVTLAPDTKNAVIEAVDAGTITLSAGTSGQVIEKNLFKRLNSTKIISTGARVDSNLFLWLQTAVLKIDNSGGGYFRNNRIIGFQCHSTGIGTAQHEYSIYLKGSSLMDSVNNVFLETIFLTPKGDTVYVENVPDITFASWNAETWCYADSGTRLMQTGPMGIFRMINGGGGDHGPGLKYGLLDIAATDFVDFGDALVPNQQTTTTYDLTLEASNLRSLVTLRTGPWSFLDENPSGLRVDAFNLNTKNFAVNGTGYVTPIPTGAGDAIRGMIMTARTGGAPWEAPQYDEIPDPAGPNWNSGLSSKPDSAALLQGYIDNGEVIPPGIYYIGTPLRLHDHKFLIGSGRRNTCIIAKDPAIDIVVGDDHADPAYGCTGMTPVEYHMADVTLQGGRNGLATAADGSGGWAYVIRSSFSYVTFRNMSGAGIIMDKICGWDNNFLDNCVFLDCAVAGFQQVVDPAYSGGNAAGMCFADKVVFYKSQFVNCGTGADLTSVRGNNLDAFVNCIFENNTIKAAKLYRNAGTSFSNCDFINNAGDPTIDMLAGSMQAGHFIGCYFLAPPQGGSSVFGSITQAEGCVFDGNGNPAAVLNSSVASLNSYTNCLAFGMGIGKVTKSGMYYNNYFESTPGSPEESLSKEAVTLNEGVMTAVMPTATEVTSPQPQLLYGSIFPQKFGWLETALINPAIRNGGFEGTGSGGMTSWAANNVSASASPASLPGPTEGGYFAVLSKTATAAGTLISKIENRDIPLSPGNGNGFMISLDACAAATDGYDQVIVELVFLKNGTTDTVVQSMGAIINSTLTTTYRNYSVTVSPTVAGWDEADVRLVFRKNGAVAGATYTGYFDNVKVTQLSGGDF